MQDDSDFYADSEKTFSDVAIEQSQNQCVEPSSLRTEDIDATAAVLTRYTRSSDFFKTLITRYYETSAVATIPASFILLALPTNTDTLKELWSEDDQLNMATARQILKRTATRLVVPPSILARQFHTLYTGHNLRLEIIGIIFSLAGLASFCLPPYDPVFATQSYPGFNQKDFALEMSDLSDVCIGICRRSNAISDLFTSLLYEDLVHLTMRHGDSSAFTRFLTF